MNKPICVISGPVATRSGYGSHARDLTLSLIKMDRYDVKIISMRWGNCPMNALNPENENDRLILDRILTQSISQQPDIWIQVSVPNEFQKIGKYNIGITAGIETTVMPIDWVKGCNNMDLILVPSEHSKTTMLNSKYQEQHKQTGQVVGMYQVDTPVEVLFEGSDVSVYNDKYNPDAELELQMDGIEEDFNYLFVGHWLEGEIGHDRKDVGMMIKTLLTVFKNKPNQPGLIIKSSRATFSIIDRVELANRIDAIKKSMSGDLPNVYLLHGDLTDDQMNSLYNHPKVKAMVSFTKGEGYGRPLQEFMFTGKPIIASNWSGHIDFLSDYAELVGGKMEKVHKSARNKFLLKESNWFTVDYNAAAQLINAVYDDYSGVTEKTKKLARDKRKKFSLSAMHDKFDELMKENVKVTEHKELVLPELKLPKLKMTS